MKEEPAPPEVISAYLVISQVKSLVPVMCSRLSKKRKNSQGNLKSPLPGETPASARGLAGTPPPRPPPLRGLGGGGWVRRGTSDFRERLLGRGGQRHRLAVGPRPRPGDVSPSALRHSPEQDPNISPFLGGHSQRGAGAMGGRI